MRGKIADSNRVEAQCHKLGKKTVLPAKALTLAAGNTGPGARPRPGPGEKRHRPVLFSIDCDRNVTVVLLVMGVKLR
jgi:hypothetical protein